MSADPTEKSRSPKSAKARAKGQSSKAQLAAKAAQPAAQKAAAEKPAAQQNAAPPSELDERLRAAEWGTAIQEWFRDAPSWLTSAIVHAVVLIVLALVPVFVMQEEEPNLVATPVDADTEEVDELEEQEIEELDVNPNDSQFEAVQSESVSESLDVATVDDAAAAPVSVELSDIGFEKAPQTDMMNELGSLTGRGLEGRGEAARRSLVRARGGTEASERAVALALAWLAEHQMQDGSWSFDHTQGLCQGRCDHPGSLKNGANMAATGMALMPFLGAGNTHKTGKYKNNVRAGLYYLTKRCKISPNGGAFNHDGGRMYGHGICSIALTEAYGMTQDPGLFNFAQAALNFISYAQDPVGGGWRYSPRQAGDTSAVGWQLMALKSGHMAYLKVNPNTIKGAMNFLDSVQSDSGAAYGYTGPGGGQATTAIGLLSRMYLGWKKDHPALERGVQKLSKWGPSKGNMYYNYYATQVMAQYEGEPWKKWNPEMRDYLVDTQSQDGHTKGSWKLAAGDHGSERGGRIYTTSMATMILEVYYRHMPIYRKQASQDEFPD